MITHMKILDKLRSNRGFLAGLAVLVVGVWFVFQAFNNTSSTSTLDLNDTVSAARKSFNLHVIERGVVKPARISPISSQISSNQAKIVWMVAEGTQVHKNMLVARFDTKPFMDSLEKAEQAYGDAQATLVASEKLLKLQEEEEAGKVEEATSKLEIALIDAANTKNGDGPLKRKVIEQKASQAKRSLEIEENELNDLNVLLEKGHISTRERDKAADKVDAAREQLAVAEAELVSFDKYVWPQMMREAELLVSGAESNLERVKRTSELMIASKASDVEKYRRSVANKLASLNQAKEDIVNCDLYAPTDGILLYAELPREGKRRKVQIGDSVWVGQTFLEVPDTTDLVAEIYVREVDVAHIRAGMRTLIEVDAFPGEQYQGEVEQIASLAGDEGAGDKVRRFKTRIRFTGSTENVYVGMSVTTKIIYRELADVLTVPISSVVFKGNGTFVWKLVNGSAVETQIRIGARGELDIEVVDGLAAGDVILRKGV